MICFPFDFRCNSASAVVGRRFSLQVARRSKQRLVGVWHSPKYILCEEACKTLLLKFIRVEDRPPIARFRWEEFRCAGCWRVSMRSSWCCWWRRRAALPESCEMAQVSLYQALWSVSCLWESCSMWVTLLKLAILILKTGAGGIWNVCAASNIYTAMRAGLSTALCQGPKFSQQNLCWIWRDCCDPIVLAMSRKQLRWREPQNWETANEMDWSTNWWW